MDQLANIIGTSGIPALVYYGFMAIASVFFAGWFLNSKLKKMCDDNVKDIEEAMKTLLGRIIKLEEDAVRKEAHSKDMTAIYGQLLDIKNDIREGFKAQTERIDGLFANKV